MKYIKTIVLAVLFLFVIQLFVLADGIKCEATTDFFGDAVVFDVTINPEEHCAFQVLPENIELDSLNTAVTPGDLVAYTGDCVSDENGNLKIRMVLKKTGSYALYMRPVTSEKVLKYPFYFVKSGDYENLTDVLNQAIATNNTTAFGDKLFNTNDNGLDNLKIAGIEPELVTETNKSEIAGMLISEFSSGIDFDEYSDNVKKFSAIAATASLNEDSDKTPDNIAKYVSGFLKKDASFAGHFDKHVNSAEAELFFTSNLLGKDMGSLADLQTESENALILTAVRYPNGNMNIKDVFETYKSLLGLSSVETSSEVYVEIAGESFATIDDLVAAYNDALPGDGGSGFSGGGSGGGGGGSYSGLKSSGFSNVIIPEANKQGAAALALPFVDLDTVDWEYPSISRLYEKGIVNGYTEHEFKPDYTVKREEFAKMLVCALKLDGSEYGDNVFSDVDGTWCEKYVNIAYNNGLTNGIGDGLFGMGSEITRQDMAVMIYKAVIYRGYTVKNAVNRFDDKDSISDYAVVPVAELAAMGIINGMRENQFVPNEKATRAQAAVIIDRALQYFE